MKENVKGNGRRRRAGCRTRWVVATGGGVAAGWPLGGHGRSQQSGPTVWLFLLLLLLLLLLLSSSSSSFFSSLFSSSV